MTCKIFFFCFKIAPNYFFSCFFSLAKGTRSDVFQEKSVCMCNYSIVREQIYFSCMFCHNQQVNLLWTEIWSAGGVERPNWEPPPRTRGQFFLCIFEINFLYSKFCSCGQLNQANPQIPPSIETYKCATVIGCWVLSKKAITFGR